MPNVLPGLAALMLLLATAVIAAAARLSLTVVKAEAGADIATGQPIVSITFDSASRQAFATFTRDNVGMAVVVRIDGEEIMRPVIREPILGGYVQVHGGMTMADARDLAARLSSGDASIEVDLVEE